MSAEQVAILESDAEFTKASLEGTTRTIIELIEPVADERATDGSVVNNQNPELILKRHCDLLCDRALRRQLKFHAQSWPAAVAFPPRPIRTPPSACRKRRYWLHSARAFERRGDQRGGVHRIALADALVAEQPKRLVAAIVELRQQHWSTDRAAELISLQRGHAGTEEIARVQIIVL